MTGWADRHIADLLKGKVVSFRPRGSSMRGRVEDGQLCVVEPLLGDPNVDDVVLCKVRGAQYLHLVKAVRGKNPPQFLIGNNRGGTNGWVSRAQIFGILTRVEP